MEDNFNTIWATLLSNGSSPRNREATRSYWDTLTKAQHQQLLTNITNKLRQGRFVHYDPIRALRENLRACKVVEPPFLHGDEKASTKSAPAKPCSSSTSNLSAIGYRTSIK